LKMVHGLVQVLNKPQINKKGFEIYLLLKAFLLYIKGCHIQ